MLDCDAYRGCGMRESCLKGKIIVLDTNVFLHIYAYSPDFSEFAIECLRSVKGSIVLPATVSIEYTRHQNKEFHKMKSKIGSTRDNCFKQLENIETKLFSISGGLKKLQLPDMTDLEKAIAGYCADIKKKFENYFDDQGPVLEMLAKSWDTTDQVYELYKEIENAGQIMPPFQFRELYGLCDTAEKRYERGLPPGYKDKDKKGNALRKYGDFLLWEELMRYAKKNKIDILFVSDDIKDDWCKKVGEKIELRDELIAEFTKRTSQALVYMNSKELFSIISMENGIDKSDAVSYALNYTDAMYCRRISEKVFEKIEESLVYSDTDYIDTYSSNIGDLGFSDAFEVLSCEFISGIQTNREDNQICYELTYKVRLAAYSSEYFGRDDDTKEVISSPLSYHEFEGEIRVAVSRTVDIFIDFEDDDDFDFAELYEGALEEVLYEPYFETESYENICPDCGCEITFANDGGNGFCIKCANRH